MNRILTFKNVKLNLGHIEGNKAVADRIIEKYALSNIDIDVTKKYFNLQNECIVECDLKSTYGMIGYLLNIPFGDLKNAHSASPAHKRLKCSSIHSITAYFSGPMGRRMVIPLLVTFFINSSIGGRSYNFTR